MAKKINFQGLKMRNKMNRILTWKGDIDKEEICKKFLLLVAMGVIIFLSMVPLIRSLNYSPLKIVAIEFTPAKNYKVMLNVPQASRLSGEALTNATNNMRTIFGLEEDVKNSILFLENSSNLWNGKISFGKRTFDFKTVTTQSSLSRGDYLSTLLKCDFVQQTNGGDTWANIYILENGSVTKYISVTIQRGNGDVLDMFTYGELPPLEELNKEFRLGRVTAKTEIANTSSNKLTLNTPENAETVLKKSKLAYHTFQDPFGNMPPQNIAIQRTDAMATNPFPKNSGENHSLSIRNWAFLNNVEQFYADIYGVLGTASWANAGVFKILNSIKTNYKSDVILSASLPEPNNLQINTPLYKSLSIGSLRISYPIASSPKGEEVKWNKEATGETTYYNKATVTVNTRGPDYYDTYDPDWKNKLVWPLSLDEAKKLNATLPSDNGFYSMAQFASSVSDSGLTANFYSEYNFSVMVGNDSSWDIYCITSKNTLLNVLLDKY